MSPIVTGSCNHDLKRSLRNPVQVQEGDKEEDKEEDFAEQT